MKIMSRITIPVSDLEEIIKTEREKEQVYLLNSAWASLARARGKIKFIEFILKKYNQENHE
jgi:hypothetical protein